MAFGSRCLSLFLLGCVLVATVACQQVRVNKVSTTYLEVSWTKQNEWNDVWNFNVSMTMDGKPICHTSVYCLMKTCSFSSQRKCDRLSACAQTTVTVQGGTFTAPTVNVIMAPDAVDNLTVDVKLSEAYITWNNPTSLCYQDTTTHVTFSDYYDVTATNTEETMTVPLCMVGYGMVEVWTRGGNGQSEATSVYIAQNDLNAVQIQECPPSECTDMNVTWSYMPVCPDVTHFIVTVGQFSQSIADTLTNTTYFADLSRDTKYETCVQGLDKDEKVLARHCTTCGTYPEVVDQLEVADFSNHTAKIMWEPPICQDGENLAYLVSASNSVDHKIDTTTLNSYEWADLQIGSVYQLCVMTQHQGQEPAKNRSNTCLVHTLPKAPEDLLARVYKDSLFVTWTQDLFTTLKFEVSWVENEELINSSYTKYKSFTIDDYEATGMDQVCVVAETTVPPGVRSVPVCQKEPFPPFYTSPDNTGMKVSVSVSAGLAVVLAAVLVVMAKRTERS